MEHTRQRSDLASYLLRMFAVARDDAKTGEWADEGAIVERRQGLRQWAEALARGRAARVGGAGGGRRADGELDQTRAGRPVAGRRRPRECPGRLRAIRGGHGCRGAPDRSGRIPARWAAGGPGRADGRRGGRAPSAHLRVRRGRVDTGARGGAAPRGVVRRCRDHRGTRSVDRLRTGTARRSGSRDRGVARAGRGDLQLRAASRRPDSARRHHAGRERRRPRRSGRAERRRLPGVRPDERRRVRRSP